VVILSDTAWPVLSAVRLLLPSHIRQQRRIMNWIDILWAILTFVSALLFGAEPGPRGINFGW
jgi:hypothetical protein